MRIRPRLVSITFLVALSLASRLCLWSQAVPQPPEEAGTKFRSTDLVEIVSLDSTIRLDIRYATSNNFMGRPMYSQARAFLQREAAEALVRVNRQLHHQGYGLLVFDGYRPWSVTKKFWDETPPAKRKFVANPAQGSRHNRGCAVDLTLYDLRTGKEVVMPSPYDDFTERAAPTYRGGTRQQRRMRDLLRRAMEREGFTVFPGEWWHFDYTNWRQYRVLDTPFEQLVRSTDH
jgi:D-alanyl-D-alanine dipeptidase